MSATVRHIFIFVALGLLSSCSPPSIDISAENIAGQQHIKLSQDWGFIFSDKQAPCVREVGLYEPEIWDRDRAAWLIEVKGDIQCLDLASVRVGDVPTGWQQVVSLSAAYGKTYVIWVDGIGMNKANITF